MLITLVIIGVIAAITVPTLINKTNKQEYVSKLKKTYSTLSQATNQIITEEGPVQNWATSSNAAYNLFRKKLLNAKECPEQGCFEQGVYTYLDGRNHSNNWNTTHYRKLVLADGSQIIFGDFSKDCNLTYYGSNNACLYITVDVNGQKKPNVIGRDTFTFVLKKQGLFPAGCEIDACNKNGSNTNVSSGYGCTCKVLREGAMNY